MKLRRLVVCLTLWACLALPSQVVAVPREGPTAAPDFAAIDAFVAERMQDLHTTSKASAAPILPNGPSRPRRPSGWRPCPSR